MQPNYKPVYQTKITNQLNRSSAMPKQVISKYQIDTGSTKL